ncbi:MAG: flagellar biosynthesis protein FlhF [Lachnospiraceae bacterium]|nr:flagellar biosynthesis protein FlhF [Lachnospiraceae bacterium]
MIIKKFNAQTEKEAMLMAREELGPDAIVMNVKTIKPRGIFALFKKSKVELTAAIDDNISDKKVDFDNFPPKETEKKSSDFVKGFAKSNDYSEEAQNAIEEKINNIAMLLEQQMSMKKEESTSKPKTTSGEDKKENVEDVVVEAVNDNKEVKSSDNKVIELIKYQLIDNEVIEKNADSIIQEFATESGDVPIDNILSKVYQKIVLKLGEIKILESGENKPKIVFFVGNTGVGKTTTMAKLASKIMLDDKKKIAMVSVDTYRIAAIDQIKTYANILSVPMEVVYTPEEMKNTVEKHKNCDFIFVDTAGRSHRNDEQKKDLQEIIDSVSDYDKEVYLVVSATVKYNDLKSISKTYENMFPYKLIFTKLDETRGWGNILNLKLETGKDLSYVTWGQNVPDDLGPVNPQVIAKKLLGGAD